tara:strand:+ start:1143 stop:1682 length:540 start_codon:yes stop_codon:yes gene_type:complete
MELSSVYDTGIHPMQQSYSSPPRIEGVQLDQLAVHSDEGGSFIELCRVDQGKLQGLPDFEILQSNYSRVMPGAIKAWHMHLNQEDVWFVSPWDSLLVALYDLRDDSPTVGTLMRFTMGSGRASRLYIPRGVAHGCMNVTTAPVTMQYFVNQRFDPLNPDEYRYPPCALTREVVWEMTHG